LGKQKAEIGPQDCETTDYGTTGPREKAEIGKAESRNRQTKAEMLKAES
jgi:hypothetical protein